MQIRQDIEALRIISAFGIVWFHAQAQGSSIAYAGLIVFLLLSTYLAKASEPADGATLKRVKRLLVPWLVWFIVFAAANWATGVPALRNQQPVAAILAGPSYHLWYMPFIFMCLMALNAIKTRASPMTMLCASGALVAATLSTSPIWLPWSESMGAPVAQYAHAAAGIFFGVFLSYGSMLPEFWRRVIILSMATAAGLLLGAAYVIGMLVGLLLTVSLPKLPRSFDVTALSSCSLGIYFIHPLFLRFLPRLFTTTTMKLALAAIFCSTIAVWIGRRSAPRLARYWS